MSSTGLKMLCSWFLFVIIWYISLQSQVIVSQPQWIPVVLKCSSIVELFWWNCWPYSSLTAPRFLGLTFKSKCRKWIYSDIYMWHFMVLYTVRSLLTSQMFVALQLTSKLSTTSLNACQWIFPGPTNRFSNCLSLMMYLIQSLLCWPQTVSLFIV